MRECRGSTLPRYAVATRWPTSRRVGRGSMSKSNSELWSRRGFVAGASCLLTFTVAGCERKLTPAQARSEGAAFRTLDAEAVATLEALGEALLPGSAAAGLAHYVDHQLSGDPADSMLIIKYLR